jgi:hypothetical protein
MAGIMTPAVLLHHFQVRTFKRLIFVAQTVPPYQEQTMVLKDHYVNVLIYIYIYNSVDGHLGSAQEKETRNTQ